MRGRLDDTSQGADEGVAVLGVVEGGNYSKCHSVKFIYLLYGAQTVISFIFSVSLDVLPRPLNRCRPKVQVSLVVTQRSYQIVCSSPNAVFLTVERTDAAFLVCGERMLGLLRT